MYTLNIQKKKAVDFVNMLVNIGIDTKFHQSLVCSVDFFFFFSSQKHKNNVLFLLL